MRYVLTILFDADDYARHEAVEKARSAIAQTPGVALISHTVEESDDKVGES